MTEPDLFSPRTPATIEQLKLDRQRLYEQMWSELRTLRHHQKEYFRTKSATELANAKKYEKRVDALIEQVGRARAKLFRALKAEESESQP